MPFLACCQTTFLPSLKGKVIKPNEASIASGRAISNSLFFITLDCGNAKLILKYSSYSMFKLLSPEMNWIYEIVFLFQIWIKKFLVKEIGRVEEEIKS